MIASAAPRTRRGAHTPMAASTSHPEHAARGHAPPPHDPRFGGLIEGVEIWEARGTGLARQPGPGPDDDAWAAAARAAAEAKDPRLFVAPDTDRGPAALALPCLRGAELAAVLLFRLRAEPTASGALELWRMDKERLELRLDQAYAPGLERLMRVSSLIGFPIGAGLPGRAWQTAAPVVLADLSAATQFMRAAETQRDGITTGLAIPIASASGLAAALLVLSSADRPLFRVFESWRATSATASESVQRANAVTIDPGPTSGPNANPQPDQQPGQQPDRPTPAAFARALETGVPQLVRGPDDLPADDHRPAGLRGVVWPMGPHRPETLAVMLW